MGQPIGVIQVINKKRGGVFGAQDERIFLVFAHQAAMAVENFTLFQKVASYHERMSVLLDVTTSVAQTLDLDDLIFKIVEKIRRQFREITCLLEGKAEPDPGTPFDPI